VKEGPVKRAAFGLLRWTGFLALAEARRRGVMVLAYHGVTAASEGPLSNRRRLHVPQSLFEDHLRLLNERWPPISLSGLRESLAGGRALPRRAAVVTFDDGYRNVLTVAVPLLQRYAVPAALFVLTGGRPRRLWLDRLEAAVASTSVAHLEWGGRGMPLASSADRQTATDVLAAELEGMEGERREEALTSLCHALGDPAEAPDDDRDLMSWDEIRQVRAAGMEIGSHADVHEPLTSRDEPEARSALAASRVVLEKELGAGRYPLSYPWGAWTGALAAAARDAGFSCALTTDPGVNSADTPLFALRRMLVGADDDPGRLRASLGGLRVARPWGYAARA